MKFQLRKVEYDFLEAAPWVMESKMELGVSPEMGWQIVCDDAAYQHWHPEVTNIEWYDEEKSGRTIVFKDLLLMILLAGPVKVWEAIDVWEKEGPVKKFSFYISHASRPNALTYKAVRELFQIEPDPSGNPNKCIFTRRVALEPGFLTRYVVGPIVFPHLTKLFEKKCVERMAKAIEEKKLPVVDKE